MSSILIKGYGKKVRHGALAMLGGSNTDKCNRWADKDCNFTEDFKVEIRKLPYLKELSDDEMTFSSKKFLKALNKLIQQTEKKISKTVSISIYANEGEKYTIYHTYRECINKKMGEKMFNSLPKSVIITIGKEVLADPFCPTHILTTDSGEEFEARIWGKLTQGDKFKGHMSLSYNWNQE